MKRTPSLILLGALAVVMAAVYARAFRHPTATSSTPAPAAAEAPEASTTPPSSAIEPLVVPAMSPEALAARESQRRRATTLAWGRDPFLAGGASGEASGLELSGILWDPAQPMAIINGQTLHPGDECEGYRVVTITQETVTLTDGAETFHLTTVR